VEEVNFSSRGCPGVWRRAVFRFCEQSFGFPCTWISSLQLPRYASARREN